MTALGWVAQPSVFPWIALVLGLCIGSFLNVVIHRLPKMLERDWRVQCAELDGREPERAEPYNLVVPRSRCPSCARPIRALENVPLLSWAALRGKCAGCGARISLRYPAVELAAGLMAAYAAWRFGFTPAAFGAMVLAWTLLAAGVIDLDTQLLPDDLTLPLLWAGLLFNLFGTFATLPSAVIGAMAGYLVLWLIYWLFKLTTGKEGMGYGDFKLLGALGAWLGWQALPLVILLSSVVGAAIGISLMLFARHARETPIPFGPYLASAGVIGLFWGPEIVRRWLPLLG
ncbi:MAG: A24 family peptidase [Betaproteobacteria bacterium]|jgi:leader peptidase (prepilin peptidase)/N-methyltransferase|nr:A24 family peptidase [Betaproteobacteria bacterium]